MCSSGATAGARRRWVVGALLLCGVAGSAAAQPVQAPPQSSPAPQPGFSGADRDSVGPGRPAPKTRRRSRSRFPGMFFAGADAITMLPIGSFSDASGLGLGVLGHLNYDFRPRMYLTGRGGFVYHLETNDVGFTQIQLPVLVGVRYLVKPKIYLGGEAGLIFVTRRFSADGADNLWTTKVGLTLSAGYLLSKDLDLRAGLWLPDVTALFRVFAIHLSVGWDLWRGRL